MQIQNTINWKLPTKARDTIDGVPTTRKSQIFPVKLWCSVDKEININFLKIYLILLGILRTVSVNCG